jgi:hypothetical protein
MPQEIIFTTLPHRRETIEGSDVLKVSVFVSVKLSTPNDTMLAQFEDILAWPQKVLDADFKFRLNDGAVLDAVMQEEPVDPELFKNIFHPGIKVDDFKEEDLSGKRINSFPAAHIQDFLFQSFKKEAVIDPKQKVTPEKFVDDTNLGAISRFSLDLQSVRRSTGPNRTMKTPAARMMTNRGVQDDQKLRQNIRQQKFLPFERQMNPKDDFSQLRKFHGVDRMERKIKIQLKKPSFEFHDILSVITSYPQLMRKLGIVLDFTIPYSSSIPAKGTIRLVPDSLIFQEEGTTVSTPATAYEITPNGFYIGDKSNSVFKQGFVKINTDDFTVVQIDADGAALKASNMVESKVHQLARYYEIRSELAVSRMLKEKELEETDPPEEEGLPAMRSAGIAITKNGMAGHLFSRINANLEIRRNFNAVSPVKFEVQPKIIAANVQPSGTMQDQPQQTGAGAAQQAKAGVAPIQTQQLTAGVAQPQARQVKAVTELKLRLPDQSLYSDDVIQGYQMDIAYESNPDQWYSLHRKQDKYTWFDESNNPHPVEGIEPDEGCIQLGVAEDPEDPDDVFVSETLARWEGWSLSVRKPGYAINESDDYKLESGETVKKDFVNTDKTVEARKYQFDGDMEFRVNAQSKVVPGSLPKLRFGNDYRIRIRAVDLAGNSVPLSSQPESPDQTIRKNIRYLRYEPLSSPIVFIGNELRDGEFLESMVIRSNFDQTAKEYENSHPVNGKTFKDYSLRYLLPPKNSQQMAETHGMFEKAFGDPQQAKEIYAIITSHEGLYEREEKTKEKIYQPNEVEIEYLPDPMAAGMALFLSDGYEQTHTQVFDPRMFSFFSNQEIRPSNTDAVPKPDDWYHAGPIRIRLEEGEQQVKWDASDRQLTVYMPKGLRTRIRFSTFWREKDLTELAAIWRMITEDSPANMKEIRDLAFSGQHWMVSPSREIELVHALQQPLDAPVISHLLPDRDFGETIAAINIQMKVHGESTEKAELQSRWTEKLDDGISVSIKDKQARNSIADIRVNYQDDVITKGTVPQPAVLVRPQIRNLQTVPYKKFKLQSQAEFEKDPQPASLRMGKVYQAQAVSFRKFEQERKSAPATIVNQVRFDVMEHQFSLMKQLGLRIKPLIQQFGDTKHRWVDYKLVAASRYREYFDKILAANPTLTTSRESEWTERVNIPSSARPKAPEIDYIIPTFEWRKSQTSEAVRHQRVGGGLRIFLKRPWYSSGDDEMLAVILPNPQAKPTMMTMLPSGYSDQYTSWGIDPLLYSVQPTGYSPEPADFRMNPVIDDDLQYPGRDSAKALVVAYPVHFDEDRQMWFCDLSVNPGNMYFPFIRLVLARYQPYSVRKDDEDVCLSPVVTADFIQLMPERQTTVVFKKDDSNSRFTITVEGSIYNERLASYGNYNFLRISFQDNAIAQPIFGTITNGTNDEDLTEEGVEIRISAKNIGNNRYSVSKEFRLPRKYKDEPFQIIIEEYERGPNKINGLAAEYQNRLEQSEETDRLIYADVFNVNAPEK